MSETTQQDPELTEAIAKAATELIAESRTALGLPKGARLSGAVAAVGKFLRDWRALDTALDGPYDDASYRAIGDELESAIRGLAVEANR